MVNISGDTVIENIKKAVFYYQEIMEQLAQSYPLRPPADFYNSEKYQEIAARVAGQFLDHPERFTEINLEYIQNIQDLIADSVSGFLGKKSEDPGNKNSFLDKRFKDPAWQQSIYFDFIRKYYMLSADWTKKIVTRYDIDTDEKRFMEFTAQQFIDAFSPSNFIFSNPEVIRESLESGMSNIAKGMENFLLDIKKSDGLFSISTTDPSFFQLGKNIAATKGKVIFQNDLMQLICYEPKKKTHAIPLFVLPPWINKYYIMDLSAKNSLIKWLVNNNFQVFLVSWVNPDEKLAGKDFEDYLRQGVLEPIEHLKNLGFKKVNGLGYCIGGTLLAIALSYYQSRNSQPMNSASFLTTLLDFANPGELGVLINKSTIGYIEAKTLDTGYMDGKYLSNSFSLIRANDLVWSYFVNNYLLGKSPAAFDILYWNSDSTNLPGKMYISYLKNMYIDNLLKHPGALKMLGEKINLSGVETPSFFLAAKNDHIALWQSVYEGARLMRGERIFCLAEGGHVAGVINPPTNTRYSHLIGNKIMETPAEWLREAESCNGSWWSSWRKWLSEKSGKITDALDYASLTALEDAPGSYVKKNLHHPASSHNADQSLSS